WPGTGHEASNAGACERLERQRFDDREGELRAQRGCRADAVGASSRERGGMAVPQLCVQRSVLRRAIVEHPPLATSIAKRRPRNVNAGKAALGECEPKIPVLVSGSHAPSTDIGERSTTEERRDRNVV